MSQDGCDGRITEYAGTGSASGSTWGCGAKSSGLEAGGVVSSSSWGSAGGGIASNGATDSSCSGTCGGYAPKNGANGGGGTSATAYGGFGAGGDFGSQRHRLSGLDAHSIPVMLDSPQGRLPGVAGTARGPGAMQGDRPRIDRGEHITCDRSIRRGDVMFPHPNPATIRDSDEQIRSG